MKYDVIVIGGGVVGLATAWRALEPTPELRLVLLEKEMKLAAHQTGNNSGVIRAGLYGGVECGPNAVFAFKREGYRKTDFSLRDTWETLSWPGFRIVARKYWRTGMGEFHRSFSKAAFVRALQRLIPEIQAEHLEPGGAGIRAQACSIGGKLLDDFHILEDGNVFHVCNAPSPAATASLAIGATIARSVISRIAERISVPAATIPS